MTPGQRIVAAAVVALTCSFLFLPGFWFWLSPTATTEVPATWPHDQDMQREIRLSAWHSNIDHVGSVHRHSSTSGVNELKQSGGERQDFRIVLE